MTGPVRFLPVVTLLSLASCQVIRVPDSSSQPEGALLFRIENATASPTDVTVQISAVEAQSAEGGPQTPTKTFAEQSLASEATIRVGPGDFSEGTMRCGPRAVVTAVVADGTQVALSGSGAGTPAFDEGSVGLSGERFLLFESDYICGDVVVVRIEDDGTGVGTSSSSIGLGSIAVYAADDLPNVDLPTFEDDPDADDGTGGDDPAGSSNTETVGLTIDNMTPSTIAADLQVGTGDSGTDESVSVAVVPFGKANGSLSCAQQVTLRLLIVEADTGMENATPTLFQINLTGAGTGTPGFDEDTIGPGNSRILVQGEHFECGDTILVTILDDAAEVDEEEDGIPRIGSGSVIVIPGA